MITNYVELCGKIQKDPVVRYSQGGMAWATWTTTVDNPSGKGKAFISCKAFGKIAEDIEKMGKAGMYIELSGHIATGSYEGRNGKVYTTDVVADSIDFSKGVAPDKTDVQASIPQGFEQLDSEDIPF